RGDGQRLRRRCGNRRMRLAETESRHNNKCDEQDLDHRYDDLNLAADFHAEIVHRGQKQDQRHSEQLPVSKFEGCTMRSKRERYGVENAVELREEVRQIIKE